MYASLGAVKLGTSHLAVKGCPRWAKVVLVLRRRFGQMVVPVLAPKSMLRKEQARMEGNMMNGYNFQTKRMQIKLINKIVKEMVQLKKENGPFIISANLVLRLNGDAKDRENVHN